LWVNDKKVQDWATDQLKSGRGVPRLAAFDPPLRQLPSSISTKIGETLTTHFDSCSEDTPHDY
jgi:hypothetical protein